MIFDSLRAIPANETIVKMDVKVGAQQSNKSFAMVIMFPKLFVELPLLLLLLLGHILHALH